MLDNKTTLEDLFLHELSDIYSAEQQLIRTLPRLARAATDARLAQAFSAHFEETHGQIQRIDEIVEILGQRLKRIECAAMKGLVEEARDVVDEIEKGAVLDAALIASAQKIEHYEIASYGTLLALANQVGYFDAEPLLRHTLGEEKAADKTLTDIAEHHVNEQSQVASEQAVIS